MSSGQGFDLIIFDCDGVLIDSELIAAREHTRTLNNHGFSISQSELMERFTGVASAEMYTELEAEFGQPVPATLHDEVKRAVLRAYESDLKPIPGIHEAIEQLRSTEPEIGMCVASSSIPVKIEAGLRVTGLHLHFAPNVFSAVQVPRGKPAPDLFLFAAEAMTVSPTNCLVIEDSLAGVQAGLAAGMTTIGFTGGSHCPSNHDRSLRDIGVMATFSDMHQLPSIILQLQATSAPT